MILQLMKSLYAHDVIDVLPLSVFWRLQFWKEISSKSKIWYPVKLFDIWIPQTATCQNWKQNYYDTFLRNMKSHIESIYITLKSEGDEKWKLRNSINSDQLCLTSTRHFWKMYRKWKFPNFQIYGFYDFVLFKSMKSTKNPQHSILCTLWHNLYILVKTSNRTLSIHEYNGV